MYTLLPRTQLTEVRYEPFRPVSCSSPSYLRRFLDLQCGSIWSDLSLLIPKLCAEETGVLLDVGCGAQPYRSMVPKGWTYRGIDQASAASSFGYKTFDTVYYTGDQWPVAEESVGVVLSTETLEHVLEPEIFLREASRCLRVNGYLLITVPFSARWHFIPFDYWRFTPSGLKHLLEKASFREVQVFARGNSVTVLAYKAMSLITPLLLGGVLSGSWHTLGVNMRFILGLLLGPLLIPLALLGQLSLRRGGGSDCIGYTAIALK